MKPYQASMHIKLLKVGSSEYEQGVVVIPSYLAKGIEFDAVIIYNASEQVYGDESLRRLFYTACTRAMHYLQLYSVGEPSPFLAVKKCMHHPEIGWCMAFYVLV